MGGLGYGVILAQDVGNFRPEPFRRIDAALKLGVVGAAPGAGQLVDFGGFGQGGVVFPEHEHGVGVVLEAGREGQQLTLRVHRAGRRAGGVHGKAQNLLGLHLAGYAAHRGFQAFEVVERVLAELVFGGVTILQLLPARVVKYVLGNFGAGAGINQQGANRVAAVVNADDVGRRGGLVLHKKR